MKNQILLLLSELSRARYSAPAGVWSDSPDLAGWLMWNGRTFNYSNINVDLKKSRAGHCYRDAQNYALNSKGLTYCEGYAQLGQEIPIPHAWCINDKGHVIDPAWRKFSTPDRHYYGVPFKNSYVREFMSKPGTESAILLWSEAGWPIQSGKVLVSNWRQEGIDTL